MEHVAKRKPKNNKKSKVWSQAKLWSIFFFECKSPTKAFKRAKTPQILPKCANFNFCKKSIFVRLLGSGWNFPHLNLMQTAAKLPSPPSAGRGVAVMAGTSICCGDKWFIQGGRAFVASRFPFSPISVLCPGNFPKLCNFHRHLFLRGRLGLGSALQSWPHERQMFGQKSGPGFFFQDRRVPRISPECD